VVKGKKGGQGAKVHATPKEVAEEHEGDANRIPEQRDLH
jgi:hypothetical protein